MGGAISSDPGAIEYNRHNIYTNSINTYGRYVVSSTIDTKKNISVKRGGLEDDDDNDNECN